MINLRKFVLSISIVFSLSAIVPVEAANNKEEVEPPLRMAPDRSKLIDILSDEQLFQKIKPINESSAELFKRGQLETQKIKQMPPHNPDVMYRALLIDPKKPLGQNREEDKTIYLSADFTTTIVFLDREGNRWPFKNYTLSMGDKILHSVIDTGTLTMQPKVQFGKGNMTVVLKGSKTPITLTIVVGAEKVDYETKVRFNEYGPYSEPVFGGVSGGGSGNYTNDLSSMSNFTKKDMLLLLQGYKPNETFEEKNVNDSNVTVWAKEKIMFIRTEDELLSPSLINSENNRLSDVNGNTVYVVPYTPSLMLLRQGQYIEVKVR